MNFLAHIYLSGEEEKLMVGNFIGDFVKGRKFNKYPGLIKNGILLHRQIDHFTDNHIRFREARKLFRDDFGLYSGIVVDLFYDHFLAKNWSLYSNFTLREFAKRTHAVLLAHFIYLPKKVRGFLPFLIQNKRLESYATADGIIKSLQIMSKYTSLPEKSLRAGEILTENTTYLEHNFRLFMSDLLEFVELRHNVIIKRPDFTEHR